MVGRVPEVETSVQRTNTRSATLTTLKTSEAIATAAFIMIMDPPWQLKSRKTDDMARLNGHIVREKVVESYPLNPDDGRMVCGCHQVGLHRSKAVAEDPR